MIFLVGSACFALAGLDNPPRYCGRHLESWYRVMEGLLASLVRSIFIFLKISKFGAVYSGRTWAQR